MFFQISNYLVLTFHIQMVYSQVTLSEVDPKDKTPPFFCKKSLTLKCQYSGTSTCCSSSTRIWRQGTSVLMNDGIEISTTGKYTEYIDATAKYFELNILNLDSSDFGKTYMCEYGFDKSTETFIKDHFLCPPCPKCGGESSGWSCLGAWIVICMITGIYFKEQLLQLVEAVKGSNVVLKCPFEAIAGKIINWEKINGRRTDSYSTGRVISASLSEGLQQRLAVTEDFDLTIANVANTDEGTYLCTLTVPGNQMVQRPIATYRIELFVLEKERQKLMVYGLISAFFGLLLNAVTTFLLGTYTCFCYSLADSAYRSHPQLSSIAIGYGVVILVCVAGAIIKHCFEKRSKYIWILIFYEVTIGIALAYAGYMYQKRKKDAKLLSANSTEKENKDSKSDGANIGMLSNR